MSIKQRYFALALALGLVAAHALNNSPGTTARAEDVEPAIRVGDPARLRALMTALEQNLAYVPGEVLVRFKADAEIQQQASVLRVLHTDINAGNSRWIGDVLHVRSADISDPEQAAFQLRSQPEVLYAQPNYLRHHETVPNDSNFSAQWNFQAINMPTTWDINPGGRADVVVAVIDSGLTTVDGSFGFRIWDGRAFRTFTVPFAKMSDFDHARVKPGSDFVFGDWYSTSGQLILFDADGHGTHVAGTLAQQTNNNQGYAGIAYGTTLLPLKACFSYWDLQLALGDAGMPGFVPADASGCPTDAIAEAIRYAADNGAKAINISLGGPGAGPAERDALQYAVSKGSFVSIAAGNEAMQGNPTEYPAAYAAEIDGVMAVGAVNRRLTRASYSSFKSYVEIAAPGGGDGPVADDIWQMGPLQTDLSPFLLSPRFDRSQALPDAGTSMAAPHIAGVAALLYSQGVTRPAGIEQALKRFARDLGPKGRDDEYGAGLVDPRTTLRGLGLTR